MPTSSDASMRVSLSRGTYVELIQVGKVREDMRPSVLYGVARWSLIKMTKLRN